MAESAALNPRRYRSAVRSGLRLVAQDVLMKSTVWSLCNVEVHATDLLEAVEPPFIVIANHSSHLDAPLVFGALPHRLSKRLATGAAADYFFDKKLKGFTTSLFFNAYPVERKGQRTRQGLTGKLLGEGIPLLIFPEGTRSRTGALGPFKPGVAALSISHNVPVLPVALIGAYSAWPYYRSLPPTNRPKIHVVFGHPLTAYPGEIAHEFAARMRHVIAELHNTTARAYHLPTLDDYERAATLGRVRADETLAETKALTAVETAATPSPESPDPENPDTAPATPAPGTAPTAEPVASAAAGTTVEKKKASRYRRFLRLVAPRPKRPKGLQT